VSTYIKIIYFIYRINLICIISYIYNKRNLYICKVNVNSIGVTMVGMHYEELKLRQQEIEVKALVALLEHSNGQGKKDVVTKLVQIAFPEKLADKLEQEDKKQTKFFTEELIRNKASDLEGA